MTGLNLSGVYIVSIIPPPHSFKIIFSPFFPKPSFYILHNIYPWNLYYIIVTSLYRCWISRRWSRQRSRKQVNYSRPNWGRHIFSTSKRRPRHLCPALPCPRWSTRTPTPRDSRPNRYVDTRDVDPGSVPRTKRDFYQMIILDNFKCLLFCFHT